MKKNKILLGVMAAAALCGVDAMAQATYHNGDMLAGFRVSGNNTEVIVDLGSISLYQVPFQSPFTPNSGVASALTSTFGGVSGVYWSVFGYNDTTKTPHDTSVTQQDPYTLWTTLARNNPAVQTDNPGVLASSDSQFPVTLDIKQIGNTIAGGTAFSAGIVQVATSANGLSYEMSLFNGGSNEGDFQGDWGLGIEHLGAGVSDLYQFDPDPQTSYLGNFALSSDGDLTFTPVPEPSTWVMLGTGLMTLIAIRRSRCN